MLLDLFKLDQRVALVTGGNRGLGFVMAKALAEAGASVAIVSRNQDSANESAHTIAQETGRQCVGYGVDVTNATAVNRLVDTVLNDFGKIDILINNAGVNIRKPVDAFDEESWDMVQNTNLKAPFLVSKAVVPHMKDQRYGRIINVASMLGMVALPERGAYCSSKGGLVQFSRVLALELAPFNVTVNALCPGPFLTELNKPVLDNPEANAFFMNHIPLGRWGNPDELRGVIAFMASEASSFMTGSALTVDGGWTAE